MTSPRNATLVYEGIASKEKRLVLFDDCYHVLTVDKQKHLVVDALTDFLTPYVASSPFAPQDRLGTRVSADWGATFIPQP